MTVRIFHKIALALVCLSVAWLADNEAAAQSPNCGRAELQRPAMTGSYHTVNGQGILLLAGKIVGTSGQDLRSFINNTRRYEEVWMCSNGGSVIGGIELGETLNRARATVRTPKDFRCVSACTISAMGGYARIIDDGGHFIIHASSGFQGLGYNYPNPKDRSVYTYDRATSLDCDKPDHTVLCRRLRELIESDHAKRFTCRSIDDLFAPLTECAIINIPKDPRHNYNMVAANTLIFLEISDDPQLVKMFSDSVIGPSIESDIQLLNYYQRMLLDGRSDLVESTAYASMTRSFRPRSIYTLPSNQPYSRHLEDDMTALKLAATNEAHFAIWQAILTDVELSVKDQLIRHIRIARIDLGVAGEEAVNIFDAMRTCQIQTSCELEKHTAEALGYHNMIDH